ncbi:type I-E CRISPR-associated protein Cas5/CasD [Rhodospirillum rubrum]|uniref:CRISPR-associated protein, Cas5e family n=1 Tax=Rhodospirillum rubrum (strain ATCC 11170 / ATH 1.1.1 / DSM 467 / LMG 4362 / NCIMB 8255 / S1) TaxID=269796 RepID=Q2RXJ5_RHORT|nr:type I-E CRISPR-associated protein Cas5/CasD [Rhodospirillum rubrum]ABC21150.1 CRISPR-associated protein, Cas5e family [Rhodospirillum rubrum ATCC 11170]AEO46821.1 CRISPR-associated Cas5e family protein [Rhodospirillum rubrum F11]MBK5952698.1 type I-E CRISPR-associated protein Cas5/CasD [Rhodospirillum rubrum]QXG80841.1 type I-E CRISPR-associated protein Cas5/CasD [Rhodospirillum rubrum]HAP98568.1 type I-E CRISPR-associated protein Cas5/CasD [Rhodospirillum rubrum]
MPEHRWLIVHLEAPLLAFGGVAIDNVGVTRDFPAASMLTGLFANALGWRRTEWERHQRLQDRLIFAARRERENPTGVLTDTQNAKLSKTERGWTTWGEPEGRDGASYGAPHRRRRDYHGDASVVVALRLDAAEEPALDDLAAALDRPARPLFIGRKSCVPSRPLRGKEFVVAATAYQALQALRSDGNDRQRDGAAAERRAVWPVGEGPVDGPAVHRIHDLPDLRNWRTGLHGGTRPIVEGVVVAQGAGL